MSNDIVSFDDYKVISYNSIIYFLVTTTLRSLSKSLFRGYGVQYFQELIERIISFESIACIARIGPDSVFLFEPSDGYWSSTILGNNRYEPEIGKVLEALSNVEFGVIDCGANYGFWSILLSSKQYGSRKVVAIEASSVTYRKLQVNCRFNGDRFRILNRAIWNKTGIVLTFLENRYHALAHLISNVSDTDNAKGGKKVETITIDDIFKEEFDDSIGAVVIKIDVEGHETEAIQGASNLLSRKDVLILYEDHGSDSASLATKFVLGLGLLIVYVSDSGEVVEILKCEDLSAIKTSTGRGYNFVAANRGGRMEARILEWVSQGKIVPCLLGE